MDLPNIFTAEVSEALVKRINLLTAVSKPLWGKMNASAMLAHCNVAFEMIYEPGRHPKPNFILRAILKQWVKEKVVNDKPYPRNSKTAPAFLIRDEKDFKAEKERLIGFLRLTKTIGESEFDGKISHSFGPLSSNEWNNMLYKHLDHHLRQFGL